jgi:Tfp pilus assembly protein PilZ
VVICDVDILYQLTMSWLEHIGIYITNDHRYALAMTWLTVTEYYSVAVNHVMARAYMWSFVM